jgi:hypothetical protein
VKESYLHPLIGEPTCWAAETTMTNRYHIQYPTRGDLAREQLRRRGVRYWVDVLEDILQRLEQFTEEQRRAFSLTWRPILDLMWDGLSGEKERTKTQVKESLEAFYASPFNHENGPEGPDEADEDAAAIIYAAECFESGEVDPAYKASGRAIGVALQIAAQELQLDPNEFEWDPGAEPMPLAQEAMHAVVQAELDRQFEDLSVIEGGEDYANIISRIRR